MYAGMRTARGVDGPATGDGGVDGTGEIVADGTGVGPSEGRGRGRMGLSQMIGVVRKLITVQMIPCHLPVVRAVHTDAPHRAAGDAIVVVLDGRPLGRTPRERVAGDAACERHCHCAGEMAVRVC